MDFLQYPLALLVTLGVLVTFHELGHFVVARWSGVRVQRFSVGFGKPLFTWVDKYGTEFVLAMIPLGGYVRMLDEREWKAFPQDSLENVEDNSYQSLSAYWRIAIALGGPLANFILAILMYWILALAGTVSLIPVVAELPEDGAVAQAGMHSGEEIVAVDGEATGNWQQVVMALAARLGESGSIEISARFPTETRERLIQVDIENWHQGEESPALLASLGITQTSTVLGEILAGSPAWRAGLKPGDRVVRVEDQEINSWGEWVESVQKAPGQTLAIDVMRSGERISLNVTPDLKVSEDGSEYGQVGVMAFMREIQFSGFAALQEGVRETGSKTMLTLNLLKKMVSGLVSTSNLSGPITIAKVAGDSAQAGWIAFTSLLALLSISLGVLNLLPIPILDGGHILFCLMEILQGKPVSERVQNMGMQLGIFVVSGMMLLAFFNDISRLL